MNILSILQDVLAPPIEWDPNFIKFEKNYLQKLERGNLDEKYIIQEQQQFKLRKAMRLDREEKISKIFWESIYD